VTIPPASASQGAPTASAHPSIIFPLDFAALADLDDRIDEKVFDGPPQYSLNELVEQTGWSQAEMKNLWLWSGLPAVDLDRRMYTQADLDGLKQLKVIVAEKGLDEKALSALIRSLGSSMERLALWQVEAITQFRARVDGLGDTDARYVSASFAPGEGPALLTQIHSLWLRHYAAAVHRLTTQALLQRGVSADDQQFPLLRAVGFANIVNFNAITARFSVPEYADFVQEFHDRAADIVNMGGGRVVKNMGNSIEFMADSASAAADIALQLAALERPEYGAQVQAGLTWCRVLTVYGDVFGPGVNLASLLARAAEPGVVLVDQAAAEVLARSDRFQLDQRAEIELEGLGPVAPVQIARQ